MTISYVSAPNKRTAVSQVFNPVNYEGTTVYMDPYAKYTTLLLKGNGTNGVINNNFQDSSSNSYAITRSGNTTQGAFTPYGSNWSNYFDGNGDYLSASSNAAFAPSTGDFTCEAWINLSALPSSGSITPICQNDAVGTSNNTKFWFGIYNNSGTIQLSLGRHDTANRAYVNWTPTIGVWYHVSAVRQSGAVKIFIDGVLQTVTGSTDLSGVNLTQNGFTVGAISTPYYMNGYISNFRYVVGTAVYTSSFTPSTIPLTAITNTSLLTCADNRFIDDSTNNFTITVSGNTSVQRFNPFTPTLQTPISYSGYFDGSGDYLSVADNTAFDFAAGDFTIEAWVNFSSASQEHMIAAQWPGASNRGWVFTIDATVPQILFAYTTNGSTQINASGSFSFAANTWYHVVACRSGTNLRLFVNGAVITTHNISTSTIFNSTASVLVGAFQSGSTPIYGSMSNFRIVKGTAVYTGAFTPPTTPLTAISGTSLLTCQSATFTDSSPNAFAITVNGNAQPVTVNPFGVTSSGVAYSPSLIGGSGYFDGTGDYLTTPTGQTPLTLGTSDFTIELWAYPTTQVRGNPSFFASDPGIGLANAILIQFNGTTGQTTLWVNNTNLTSTSTTNYVKLNQWNHIAVCRSGGSTYSLYINGVAVNNVATNSTSLTTNSWYIGYWTVTDNAYTGYITDFRILKGTALYTAGFAPPISPLTSITNTSLLLSYTNAGIYDDTMSNDLETVGNTNVSTSTKKYGTGSMYFDGSGDYIRAIAGPVNQFGGGDLTIEFWFYQNSRTAGEYDAVFRINSAGTGYNADMYMTIGAGVGGYTFLVANNARNGWAVLLSPTGGLPALSTWHHMAIVRYGSVWTVYLNGMAVGTASYSGTVNTPTGAFEIGWAGTSDSYWDGYIDDFRVTRGIARYTTEFTPPQAELPFFGDVKTYNSDTIDLGGVDFPVFRYNTLLLKGDGTNGAQNNTFLDSSSNNFTVTSNGNTTQGTFTPYGDNWSNLLPSTSGSCLRFGTSTNLALGSGDFTVEMWAYINALASAGYSTFLDWRTNGNTPSNIPLLGDNSNNGKLAFVYGNGGGWTQVLESSTTIPLNIWTHIALVRSGTTVTLYFNGTSVASATSSVNFGNETLSLGQPQATGAYTPNAYFSNLRIVKGSAVYTGAFTPPTTPLTAITNTQLLTCHSNRFIDGSSNNFTVTVATTPSVQRFSPFAPSAAYSTSTVGGSAYFDGTGDYLTVPNNAVFDMSTGDCTIEAWVYTRSLSGTQAIFSTFPSGGTITGYSFLIGASTGYLILDTYISGGNQAIVANSNPIPINTWTHVAYTRSGGTNRLFVNGSLCTTSTNNLTQAVTSGGNTAGIGTQFYSGYAYFMNGYIANLRVVKGTAIYTSAFAPSIAPVTAVSGTSLLTNFTNAAISDNAMMNDLETVGNAQVSTSVKKYGTGSMYFDGTGDYLVPSAASSNSNLAFGTGDFTIEFWVYFIGGLGSDIVLYDSRPLSTNGAYTTLYVNSSSQLSYVVSSTDRITSSTAFTTSTWYHVAVCRSASVTKMFINGVQVGTSYSDTTTYLNTARRPVIAINGYNETAAPLNGYIDDLRVTKGFARYTMNFIPPIVTLPTA